MPAGSKVMVLAANCFSGQDLVDRLLDDDRRTVIGIGRSPERSTAFARYKSHPNTANFVYHRLDLNTDSETLLRLMDREQPDAIVNFAAQGEVATSWKHPEQWFQTNALAVARLVKDLCRRDYLKCFLQISTPEVYGSVTGGVTEDAPIRPSTPYAASKAAGDLVLATYAKEFGFPLVTVRATNVFGARQQLYRIVPRTIIRLKQGKRVELHGGGMAEKSYIHIRDVSEGELSALEKGRPGEVYHLSPDGGPIKIRDLVRQVCELMGRDFRKSVIDVDERPGQDAAYEIDSSKARRELNWSPRISLEDGLREVIDWIGDNWGEIQSGELEYRYRP